MNEIQQEMTFKKWLEKHKDADFICVYSPNQKIKASALYLTVAGIGRRNPIEYILFSNGMEMIDNLIISEEDFKSLTNLKSNIGKEK